MSHIQIHFVRSSVLLTNSPYKSLNTLVAVPQSAVVVLWNKINCSALKIKFHYTAEPSFTMTRLVLTNPLLVKACWIRFTAATQASVNSLELNHPTGILLCH